MYGVDYLYGYGAENAINFGYCVNAERSRIHLRRSAPPR